MRLDELGEEEFGGKDGRGFDGGAGRGLEGGAGSAFDGGGGRGFEGTAFGECFVRGDFGTEGFNGETDPTFDAGGDAARERGEGLFSIENS